MKPFTIIILLSLFALVIWLIFGKSEVRDSIVYTYFPLPKTDSDNNTSVLKSNTFAQPMPYTRYYPDMASQQIIMKTLA